MSDHIISLIESAPLASLSPSDLTAIRRHTDDCVNCRQAFDAAQISMLLLRERAAETFEPSPFFHTRVPDSWWAVGLEQSLGGGGCARFFHGTHRGGPRGVDLHPGEPSHFRPTGPNVAELLFRGRCASRSR
jgi:hypothetical protein